MASKAKPAKPKKPSKADEVIDAEFETLEDIGAKESKSVRSRPAWSLVIILFAFSLIGGAAIGLLAQPFMPFGNTTVEQDARAAKADARLRLLEAKLAILPAAGKATDQVEARIAALEKAVKKAATAPVEAVDLAGVFDQLSALETRVTQLEARPKGIETEAGALDLTPLVSRLEALEAEQGVDLSLYARLEDLPAPVDVRSWSDRITALEQKDPASLTQETAMLERIASLEQSFDEQADVAQAETKLASRRAAKAKALADLQFALTGNAAFMDSWQAANLAFPQNEALQSIRSLAQTGVPGMVELQSGLQTSIPNWIRTAQEPAKDAGLLDKANAGLRQLVSIRRTDGKGDDIEIATSKAENAIAAGNLAEAITAIEVIIAKAPEANIWLQQAKHRQNANQVLQILQESMHQQSNDGDEGAVQ